MKGTRQRSVVLSVFLNTPKPVSASELLYPVKKEDLNVSLGSVYRTLKLIVASGLATQISSADGVARYRHELRHELNLCSHQHLVCKDCGEAIHKAP
jgi:Fur family transcriptional regulator, ferric uptake regulator